MKPNCICTVLSAFQIKKKKDKVLVHILVRKARDSRIHKFKEKVSKQENMRKQ